MNYSRLHLDSDVFLQNSENTPTSEFQIYLDPESESHESSESRIPKNRKNTKYTN